MKIKLFNLNSGIQNRIPEFKQNPKWPSNFRFFAIGSKKFEFF